MIIICICRYCQNDYSNQKEVTADTRAAKLRAEHDDAGVTVATHAVSVRVGLSDGQVALQLAPYPTASTIVLQQLLPAGVVPDAHFVGAHVVSL